MIDASATAFVLVCASLVLLMTPGLALFYGGMTRAKSVLNMMMMSFGAMGVVGVIYVLWGYSMSFGGANLGGIIGNPFENFGLRGVVGDATGATLDADGFMVIRDRCRDIIKSGGEWISTVDLENIAISHPKVANAAAIAALKEKL